MTLHLTLIFLFGVLLTGALYMLYKIHRRQQEVYDAEHPTLQYVLQKEWNDRTTKYDYVFYQYEAWEEDFSINIGYRAKARGNLTWARKQAKHYGLADPDPSHP